MPTFRRLPGPPAELPTDSNREVVCPDRANCAIHRSQAYRSGSWTVRQRNIFEVFWQRIQHFKFEYMGGVHQLGQCDQATFLAFSEILGIRGLHWESGCAYYIRMTVVSAALAGGDFPEVPPV